MKKNSKVEVLTTDKFQPAEKVMKKIDASMAARAKERAGKPLTFPAKWLKAVDEIDYNERGYLFDIAVSGWYAGVAEKYFKKYLRETERVIWETLKSRGRLAADKASNLVLMETFPGYYQG